MAACWQGAQRGHTGSGVLRRGPNRPGFFVPQKKDQSTYGELENHHFSIYPLVLSNIMQTGKSQFLVAGWWLKNPSEKDEFVSWDYEIPNLVE